MSKSITQDMALPRRGKVAVGPARDAGGRGCAGRNHLIVDYYDDGCRNRHSDFEKNADEQRAIVNATKLMTPLLTSETLKDRTLSHEDQATVSKAATRRIGSRTLSDTGAVYALEKLLKSTVIANDSDSAYA